MSDGLELNGRRALVTSTAEGCLAERAQDECRKRAGI